MRYTLAEDALVETNSLPIIQTYVSFDHEVDNDWFLNIERSCKSNLQFRRDKSVDRAINSDLANLVCANVLPSEVENSLIALVLVGKETWRRKYIDWEIDVSLRLGGALIGIQLPTLAVINNSISMPGRLLDNVRSGYADWLTYEEFLVDPYARISQKIKRSDPSKIVNGKERLLKDIAY